MASKAIEEKKQEMEATMVTLGDKVGSNIQQGLTSLPGTGVRRAEDQDYQAGRPLTIWNIFYYHYHLSAGFSNIRAHPDLSSGKREDMKAHRKISFFLILNQFL